MCMRVLFCLLVFKIWGRIWLFPIVFGQKQKISPRRSVARKPGCLKWGKIKILPHISKEPTTRIHARTGHDEMHPEILYSNVTAKILFFPRNDLKLYVFLGHFQKKPVFRNHNNVKKMRFIMCMRVLFCLLVF